MRQSAGAAWSGGLVSNLEIVADKSERRAARSVVAEYHDAQLRELVGRVGDGIDRFRVRRT